MEVEEAMSSSTVLPEHYLATDSFSYSWLVNPLPTATKPTTWATTSHNSFYFDVSVPDNNSCTTATTYYDYSSPLAHADELFSNGIILPAASTAFPAPQSPLSTSERTTTTFDTAASSSTNRSTFLVPSSPVTSFTKIHHQQQQQQQLSVFPKKFRGVSMKTVYRYLGCLLPVGFRGKRRTRVDDFDRRAREEKSMTSGSNSPYLMSPPRTSSDEYYQSENSIKEAIRYCKRSSTGGA